MSRNRRGGRPPQNRPIQGASPPASGHHLSDSFQNMQARMGQGAGSIADGSTYALTNLITRQPRTLEYMYRGSWIVGVAVDSIADDMTKEGVDFGSTIEPGLIQDMSAASNGLALWRGIGDVIRWSRLYGGAIGVHQIEGQDLASPLRPDTVTKDQYKGIVALGRWELMPNVVDVIGNMGPSIGNPEYYQVGPNAAAFANKKIHHSRVFRMEGIRLPYFQRIAEQGWGMSIVERMFDRLLAYDSATTGAAQLIFKAYLRTVKIKGLRQILAAGGPAELALAKRMEAIRQWQTSEGLTVLDAEDEFETTSYTFTGLDDILMQFGEQVSGAVEVPMVRLFGQTPSGLNSSGEADLVIYEGNIKSRQERNLRVPVGQTLDLLHRSVTGKEPPKGFNFTFNSLRQMSDKDKADTAKVVIDTISIAFEAAIIDKPTALRELKQNSEVTGIFTNIDDEMIKEAELEPPPMPGDGELPVEGKLPPAAEAQGPAGPVKKPEDGEGDE